MTRALLNWKKKSPILSFRCPQNPDQVYANCAAGHPGRQSNLARAGTECGRSTPVINCWRASQSGGLTGCAEFSPRPCDPDTDLCENNVPYAGTFDWFAANGDEIYGNFEGYLCPTETPGVFDNHETAEITGGTGRFANATGHFELGGQLDFTTNPPSFVLPWEGVISLHRHGR